jgi:hypothetical protein
MDSLTAMPLAFLGWTAETWGPVIAAAATIVAVLAAASAWKSARAAADTAEEARRGRLIAEQSLALERERSHREVADYTERVAPRWQATELDERGYFSSDGSHLEGSLRNGGLHGARILLAVLDMAGPRAAVQTRCDGTASGGWEEHPDVPPGSVLQLRCDLDGLPISGDARPMLYMDYEAPGLNHPPFGVTVELLRQRSDARGHTRWRVGAVRNDVRA